VNIIEQKFTSERLAQIQSTIAAKPDISRRELARQVCEWLDWRSANGKLQEMSCRKALLKLHQQGHIELPEAKMPANFARPSPGKSENELFAGPSPVDCSLAELGQIKLVGSSRVIGHRRAHGMQ